VIVIAARDIVRLNEEHRGFLGWLNFSEPQTELSLHDNFQKLYSLAKDTLMKEHNLDQDTAARRIGVLVSHMDMLDEKLHTQVRDKVKSALRHEGVPENYVFFGSKPCKWEEVDLRNHDSEVEKILTEARKRGVDYWKILPREFAMRIDDMKCKGSVEKPDHEHKFTEQSKKCFKDLLLLILNLADVSPEVGQKAF
jgi:hypothetical protein